MLVVLLAASLPALGGEIRLYSPPKSDKVSLKLRTWISARGPAEEVKLWVFFTDKGIFTQDDYRRALAEAERGLSDRARRRRLRGRRGSDIVSFCDIPVHQPYVDRIRRLGVDVVTVSRWLNGVSVRAPVRLVPEIEQLSFVREMRKVAVYRKQRYTSVEKGARFAPPRRVPEYIDYGFSELQLEQLNVPQAHGQGGYTGSGVLVCMLDTGFERNHKSLRHIENQILAEWDFINNDSLTSWQEDDPIDQVDPDQTDHGTRMLSLIAGYRNSQIIGPAFGASYALAKTEIRLEEIVAEEDYWVAASEWADSLGADIISSSLGYRSWEDSLDYSYTDMDGNTTPMTIAADSAARVGILVVTAMGNVSYLNPSTRPDTCIKAPADADSIIAVGGVDEDCEWAWNPDPGTGSIIGPSYDQTRRDTLPPELWRWKPDLVAAWACVVADPNDPDSIQGLGGTSCATALVAGVAALAMEANPSWSNLETREALLQTASNHQSPNDTIGWGCPDAWEAIHYRGEPEVKPFSEDELMDPYPNPFSPQTHSEVVFPYRLINETYPFLRVYTTSGELVREFDLGRQMPGRFLTPGTGAMIWDGHNDVGDLVGSGIYICVLSTGYRVTTKKLAVVR